MNTEYIDVSEINVKGPGAYIHHVAATAHPVLVYMPNLDYAGMDEAEDFALKMNISFIILPITLPMLDLIRQMEYAGIHISERLMAGLESALRSAIIDQLNLPDSDSTA